jgi:glycosyltransferase involved in cell wall biosynthesis
MASNVLLIWDRMGDYHRARWSAVQSFLSDREVFAADFGGSDKLYGWKTTSEKNNYFLLSNASPDTFDISRIRKFSRILKENNIGVVCIPGYGRPEYVILLALCTIMGRHVILFAESWYGASSIVERMKAGILKSTCDGYLVSGERARMHFADRLGINERKILTGYSVVDNQHFASSSSSSSKETGKELLCVARFAEEKNLSLLIDAFVKSVMPEQGWRLTLVGGGPQEEELRFKAHSHPVTLLAWQPYNALPALYQHADVFVLPSIFEPWGLVVNEAMAAGLPVLLSHEVGCLPDLLQEGVNGWSFPSKNEGSLLTVLNQIAGLGAGKLKDMGEASRKIISNFSPERFAMQIGKLIEIK